jgi:RNA polymerase sigma-70 factor, ECF subfamily
VQGSLKNLDCSLFYGEFVMIAPPVLPSLLHHPNLQHTVWSSAETVPTSQNGVPTQFGRTTTRMNPQPTLSSKARSDGSSGTMSEYSDEELFARIRDNSDEAAFNTLYTRYDKRLYAYCLRATSTHDAAKDAFQTVMSTVFEKRATFTGGSYAAWLFTIARHHVMKVSKRQQRTATTTTTIDEHFEDSGGASAGLLATLGTETGDYDFLLQQSLDRAIAQLPEDLREAFELKYFDGLQHEEIADTLNITVSLAKVRVFRAKQQLRQSLASFFKEVQ